MRYLRQRDNIAFLPPSVSIGRSTQTCILSSLDGLSGNNRTLK